MADQHVAISISDDRGELWSDPFEPFDPPRIDGRRGLFRAVGLTPLGTIHVLAVLCWVDHSDPYRPFYNEQTQGLLDTKIFLSRSNDCGENWSAPTRVRNPLFDVPTPITGPVLCLANGDLAVPFELNKPYDDPAPWRHAAVFLYSKDQGHTWTDHTVTAQDPENRVFYWDQRPGILADGRILNLFWTYDTRSAEYRNIHACESLDHGRTWSAPWDTGLAGQPAAPVPLRNGLLALAYVDRTRAPRILLRTSEDRGRTWPQRSEIVLHESDLPLQTALKSNMNETWAEMNRFSLGLPAATLTDEGDLLVVYYAGHEPDLTAIHWVRVAAV
jgi:hypothetical protein